VGEGDLLNKKSEYSYFVIFLLSFNKILDFPFPWQCLFQEPATTIMENIIDLHHDIIFFLCVISVLVIYMLSYIIMFFKKFTSIHDTKFFGKIENKKFPYLTHNTAIEIIWILIPTLILIIIAIPSFSLIYIIDEINSPEITLKIIGHQWYWTYEFGDFVEYAKSINKLSHYFHDSYMLKEEDLVEGQLRLLSVDFTTVFPENVVGRLLISSSDVIHSWTIPSLGVKMDAVPGRLNQIGLLVNRQSVFYGQCSELCGINHSFMPICLETVDLNRYFLQWVYFILPKI
jgi:cytochrome c oxidase subunit 2